MLTGDLVRARVVKGRVRPMLIDPDSPEMQARARELIRIFRDGVGERRAELEEILTAWSGGEADAKLFQGLVHLVERRAEYGVDSPIPPGQLRVEVFREAAARGPLAAVAVEGGPPTAEDIYRTIAERHSTPEKPVDPLKLPEALYADHPDAMRLLSVELPGDDSDAGDDLAAEWLLHRYNTALVQTILFSATSLIITLQRPTPARARQLFRAIKFHQLIHAIIPSGTPSGTPSGPAGDTDYRIILDGPASLFSQTSRYGVALARFLPALLLQPGDWELEAPLLWKGKESVFAFGSLLGLRSHYRDVGGWTPREAQWLIDRLAGMETGWEVVTEPDPVQVGDVVIVPDLTFRQGRRVAHLEILGFWRKGSVQHRLALLKQPSASNLILAVSRRLCGEEEEQDLQGVIPFAEVIPAKEVLKLVEARAKEA